MSSVLLLVLPDTSCNGSRHWGRCTGLFHHIWISWVWWWWLWIWQWPWRSWILGFLTWPHVFWYTGPIFACPFPRSTLWLSIGQHDMTQMILLYIISLYIYYIIYIILYIIIWHLNGNFVLKYTLSSYFHHCHHISAHCHPYCHRSHKETFFSGKKNIFLMKTWSSQGHENSSLPSGHCKGQIAVAWGSES